MALVTGASRGIGRAIAVALAEQGAALAITARSADALEALARELRSSGATAEPFVADLRDAAAIERLAAAVDARFGRLDVLVNNAGVGHFAPLSDTSLAMWDELMALNARAPFLLCRAFVAQLRRAAPGTIVNLASVVGIRGYPGQAAYGASKHALVGLSRALTEELLGERVRVHTICPGGTATDMLRQARPDLDPGDAIQPHEIAELVVFLVTRTGNALIDQVQLRRAAAAP